MRDVSFETYESLCGIFRRYGAQFEEGNDVPVAYVDEVIRLLASPVQPSCDTCRDEKRVTTMVPGFTGEPVEGEVDCPDCVAIRPAYPPRQPGRSEAEIKAEALNEAADEFDLIWNRGHDRSVHPDSHILRARAARVADTTDTEGGE